MGTVFDQKDPHLLQTDASVRVVLMRVASRSAKPYLREDGRLITTRGRKHGRGGAQGHVSLNALMR